MSRCYIYKSIVINVMFNNPMNGVHYGIKELRVTPVRNGQKITEINFR